MVVENKVLMKVVLPRPDSPATCSLVNSPSPWPNELGYTHHNGEGCTALRNDLVSVRLISHVSLPSLGRCRRTAGWEAGDHVSINALSNSSLRGKIHTLAMPMGEADSMMSAFVSGSCGAVESKRCRSRIEGKARNEDADALGMPCRGSNSGKKVALRSCQGSLSTAKLNFCPKQPSQSQVPWLGADPQPCQFRKVQA